MCFHSFPRSLSSLSLFHCLSLSSTLSLSFRFLPLIRCCLLFHFRFSHLCSLSLSHFLLFPFCPAVISIFTLSLYALFSSFSFFSCLPFSLILRSSKILSHLIQGFFPQAFFISKSFSCSLLGFCTFFLHSLLNFNIFLQTHFLLFAFNNAHTSRFLFPSYKRKLGK